MEEGPFLPKDVDLCFKQGNEPAGCIKGIELLDSLKH